MPIICVLPIRIQSSVALTEFPRISWKKWCWSFCRHTLMTLLTLKELSKPSPDAPKKPDNILVYKTKCVCCGGSVLVTRHHTHSDKFIYKCSKRRKLAALCGNKSSYEYNEVMDNVFSVIRQHMNLCIEKKFVQKMNSRKRMSCNMTFIQNR